MKILAIETSCDETAIATAEFTGEKMRPDVSVLSNIVSSQIEIHQKFGGVVPNLAKREHQRNLIPVLLRTLKESGLRNSIRQLADEIRNSKQIPNSKIQNIEKTLEREPELLKQFVKHILPLPKPEIDVIAVTYGPGLAPALWVGVNFARALAVLWEKPLIPVNHMAGHFYSAFLQKSGVDNGWLLVAGYKFPILALLVSGGHTELVLMKSHGKFKVIGETLDDAAGEAFDKVARILGLGYPGGPKIAKLAEAKSYETRSHKIKLPRPMIGSNNYDFSFSGLKTAVLYLTRDLGAKQTKKLRPLIAKEFQEAIVEVLVKKTIRAAKEHQVKTILLGGGVAANKLLREQLGNVIHKEIPNSLFLIPDPALTGDNALMIALAAHFQWASLAPKGRAAYFTGKKKAWNKVHADANLRLSQ